jgi:hypothetical protein
MTARLAKGEYQFRVATNEYIGKGKERPSTSPRERLSPAPGSGAATTETLCKSGRADRDGD